MIKTNVCLENEQIIGTFAYYLSEIGSNFITLYHNMHSSSTNIMTKIKKWCLNYESLWLLYYRIGNQSYYQSMFMLM